MERAGLVMSGMDGGAPRIPAKEKGKTILILAADTLTVQTLAWRWHGTDPLATRHCSQWNRISGSQALSHHSAPLPVCARTSALVCMVPPSDARPWASTMQIQTGSHLCTMSALPAEQRTGAGRTGADTLTKQEQAWKCQVPGFLRSVRLAQ